MAAAAARSAPTVVSTFERLGRHLLQAVCLDSGYSAWVLGLDDEEHNHNPKHAAPAHAPAHALAAVLAAAGYASSSSAKEADLEATGADTDPLLHEGSAADPSWTLPEAEGSAEGCCVPRAATARSLPEEAWTVGCDSPPPPLTPRRTPPRSALRTRSTPRRSATPLRVSFSSDDVLEFQVVAGQEWWHNDAKSSQIQMACGQQQCECGGIGGAHTADCCWRTPV